MNTIIQLAAVFLAITSTIHPALAQGDQPRKIGELEIGFGSSYSGTAKQMANLMREYDFDATSPGGGWFGGGPVQHPTYSKSGITVHLSYSHSISLRSQLGIHFNYTGLNQVSGYSSVAGNLIVDFSSVSIAPIYSFELANFLEFEAGPSLMINSANKSNMLDWNEYTRISPGLFTGLSLKIWNLRGTYGKLGAHYLLTTAKKMGPFRGTDSPYSASIPESNFNFSHLKIFFALGLKLL